MILRPLCLGAALLAALVVVPRASAETALLFATAEPAPSADSERVFRPWAERVAAAAGGAVRIEVEDGTASTTPATMYDRVTSDAVQIGLLIPSLAGGRFPSTELAGLPFLTADSQRASVAFWRLYEWGGLTAEYKDIVPLAFALFPPQGVHLAKPPDTLEDLKGLRLRVVSKVGSDSVARLGGTPLALDPGDQYEALQRGLLDGVVSSWLGIGPLHLDEVTSYHVETALGTGMFIVFMTKKKHDTLPAPVQRAIDAQSGESLSRALAASFEQRSIEVRAPVEDSSKHTVVQLEGTPAKHWRDRTKPLIDEWAASHPGGAELVATYRRLLAAVE